MKKKNLLWVLLILQLVSFGQNEVMNTFNSMRREIFNLNLGNQDDGVAGSPYLSEEFTKATFYPKNKPAVESDTRLNYYQSRFEFKIEKDLYMVDPAVIDSVRMNDCIFVFKTFEVQGNSDVRTVERIGRSEKGTLYKYTESVFKPEVKAIGYTEPEPASFKWEDPVYLVETGGEIIMLTNLNKFIDHFPGKESDLKKFIKSEKIKKNDPYGLMLLLKYADKL